MVNLGGLEIKVSINASEKFKKNLKYDLKLAGAMAALCVGSSMLATYPHIKNGIEQGYIDSGEFEKQFVFSLQKGANDETLPYLQRFIMRTGIYLTWPGRQINYLIFMDKRE